MTRFAAKPNTTAKKADRATPTAKVSRPPPKLRRSSLLDIDSLERTSVTTSEDREPERSHARDLTDAAIAEPGQLLPNRFAFEMILGVSLHSVRVHRGPHTDAALHSLKARAATFGQHIFIRADDSSPETLAHEVVHAAQQVHLAPHSAPRIEPATSPAEFEATQIARRLVAFGAPSPAPDASTHAAATLRAAERLPMAPRPSLQPKRIALRRQSPVIDNRDSDRFAHSVELNPDRASTSLIRPLPEHSDAPVRRSQSEQTSTTLTTPASPATPLGSNPVPAPDADAMAALASDNLAVSSIPAAVDASVDEDRPMPPPQSVEEAVENFSNSFPTHKARQARTLSNHVRDAIEIESHEIQESLPTLKATLTSAQAPTPGPLTIQSPAPREITGLGVSGEVAAIEIQTRPDMEPFSGGENIARAAATYQEDSPTREADLQHAIDGVPVTDPGVSTSLGARPVVPLEGQNDPAQLATQHTEASRQAIGALDEAQSSVVTGPGPERVQASVVNEVHDLGRLDSHSVQGMGAMQGPDDYLALGLTPDVQNAFDQQQHTPMSVSLSGARDQITTATSERDRQRDEQVAAAEAQADGLSQQHDAEQHNRVREARASIQASRRSTIAQQQDEVNTLDRDASEQSRQSRATIDTRVTEDERAIQSRYDSAEQEAQAEVAGGEHDAAERRAQAERDAANQSWWDRAVDFVKSAFEALAGAITAIFDAVRTAVTAVLDAAASFAHALIDAAAGFIKGAISAFGEVLKGLVNALLSEVFPELARQLTEAIDGAVAAATSAVDAVADRLHTAVDAVANTLKAGLNAVLGVFQAAIQGALAILEAAITGDWSGLLRKVLEAVLSLLGIAPDDFYNFVGRAEDTFSTIIRNPLAFVGNLVNAFVGGVRLFADRFSTHLLNGVLGWLTGALGASGIVLPDSFDLRGVFDLVRQILGLTWARLRERAVRLLGEQSVEVIEHVAGYLQTLVEGGWHALFEQIRGDVASLRDQVLQGLQSFLVERVVMAGIRWLASLFTPVGALVQLVMTAWNLITFLRDQLRRMFEIARTLMNGLASIARGVLEPAMLAVEGVLAGLLPLALDLLARLLGLGNVGEKVREIIESVRARVDLAIDGLITRAQRLFRRGTAATTTTPSTAEGVSGSAASDLGERLTFDVEGDRHALYIKVHNANAVVMVQSTPTPLQTKLDAWRDRATTKFRANQRQETLALIKEAEKRLEATDASADQTVQVHTQDTTTRRSNPQNAVVQNERHLLEILDDLFRIFKDERIPIGENAEDRFELARSIGRLQSRFQRRDWEAQFFLAQSTASSDLRWGQDNHKLDATGDHYELKMLVGHLVETGVRIFISEARRSPAFDSVKLFQPSRIKLFLMAHPRMPNDAASYTDTVVNRITGQAERANEIVKLSRGYRFAGMPARRAIPEGFDVRERYYIVGSGFSTERVKVLQNGIGRIDAVLKALDNRESSAPARWTALKRASIVADDIRDAQYNYADTSLFDIDHITPLAKHWVAHRGNDAPMSERRRVAGGSDNLRILLASVNRSRGAEGAQYVQSFWVGPNFTHEGADRNYAMQGVEWDWGRSA